TSYASYSVLSLIFSTTTPPPRSTLFPYTTLFRSKDTGGLFQGQLDDLRIYTRTLTDTEVENLAVHLPARVLLTELAGAPATEITTLEPDKPPQEADIGELAKAESKEQKQARLEKQHQARLTEYFLKHDAPEKYRQLYSRLAELRKERDKLEKSITTTMVMAEMSKARDTFILGRGKYDNRGEKVTPGVPSFRSEEHTSELQSRFDL